MSTTPAKDYVMKDDYKIKLSEDDFVLIGMNYIYFMIPRLAHPKENLEKLKQRILNDQMIAAELRTVWNDGTHESLGKISQIMEKYFGKRAE